MTQRTKLELEVNRPTEITLLFDEPISGKSQYGEYHMYAVAVGDEEYSFFAPAEVNKQLNKLAKGDKVLLTKLAAQRGSKVITTYDIKVIGKLSREPVAPSFTEGENVINDDFPTHDAYFGIMLDSYRDALEISRELNGMADPEKIAVTLFIARSKYQGD